MPNVREIGPSAFQGCTSLASGDFPKAILVGGSAFLGCGALTLAALPWATYIGKKAFQGCDELNSVSIPLVATIGEDAFRDCVKLASVDMQNVLFLRSGAFGYCSALTEAEMPKAIDLGADAFRECAALKSVTMPLVETIGEYAFIGCSALEKVDLPMATEMGQQAFAVCKSLWKVSIPKVGKIPFGAFGNCTSLLDMTISDSVSTVGEYAFYKCDELNIIRVVGDEATDYSSLLGMLPEFSTIAVYSDAAVDISKIRDGDENTHITRLLLAPGTVNTVNGNLVDSFDNPLEGNARAGKIYAWTEGVFKEIPSALISFEYRDGGGNLVTTLPEVYLGGADVEAPPTPGYVDEDGRRFRFAGWEPSFSPIADGDAAYVAQYVQYFTITYHPYDAVDGRLPKTYDKGAKTVIPEGRKSGYFFRGWYLDDSFEGKQIWDTQGRDDDLILYGKFEAIPSDADAGGTGNALLYGIAAAVAIVGIAAVAYFALVRKP